MSDFGALISIRKTNQEAFSEQEIEKIGEVCEHVKAANTLTDALSEPYLFTVGKTKAINTNDCYEVNILLSDHWGDDFEWFKKVEVKDMKVIADSLSTLLPQEYILKQEYGWW